MNTVLKLCKVWWKIAINRLQIAFINRATSILFILGKAVRMGMQLVFLTVLHQNTSTFAGYPAHTLIVFFAILFFLDMVTQMLFRGVYMFSEEIRSGSFDRQLLNPLPTLMQALFGQPDINDLLLLVPSTGVLIYAVQQVPLAWENVPWALFTALLLNSFIIATAFHILILVFTIWYISVDGLMWMYRDLTTIARYPLNMFPQIIQFVLFFIIPVGFMSTIPAEVLISAPLSQSIALTFGWGIGSLLLSLFLWNRALKSYTSAGG